MHRLRLSVLVLAGIVLPGYVSAHQPKVVFPQDAPIDIYRPTVSQAFYAELVGASQQFRITAPEPLTLYIELLSPVIDSSDIDYSAAVIREAEPANVPIAWLSATSSTWESWREPWAGDIYRKGPSMSTTTEAGTYIVTVESPDNTGKFVLVVGTVEQFGIMDILTTARTLPIMKAYLGVPPLESFQNRVGAIAGGVLLVFIILLFGILRLFARTRVRKVPRITA